MLGANLGLLLYGEDSVMKNLTSKLLSICNLHVPECFDDTVQCDKCKTCYHKFWVNAPFNIKTREPLYPKLTHGIFRTEEFPRHAMPGLRM